MKGSKKLGSVLGIDIIVHYSWFIIAFLIGTSLVGQFTNLQPLWAGPTAWTAALVTALLFFVSILLHEFSHAMVARLFKLPVKSITLFALGGVANIEKESEKPHHEFWIGIVGPITSVVIGVLCIGAAGLLGWDYTKTPPSPAAAAVAWLGYINIMLAVFNMIPGFPLDGGRVLRATIWWLTGNEDKATRLASNAGQIVAYAFIAFGIWQFASSGAFSGLWLAMIGWFLAQAARNSYAQHQFMSELKSLKVEDLMADGVVSVRQDLPLSMFVNNYLLKTWRRYFVVVDHNGFIKGLITANEIKDVGREEWDLLTVSEVMRPIEELKTLDPKTPASDAVELISKEELIPVVSEGRVHGIVSRTKLFEIMQTRAELSA